MFKKITLMWKIEIPEYQQKFKKTHLVIILDMNLVFYCSNNFNKVKY